MGIATAPNVEQVSSVKLAAADEEKVSNIVEVCQVSRDEALRVLDACRMDETMAIERFLSGNHVETWSRVSKKKKPASQPRSGPAPRSSYAAHTRPHDRDRERDRDRDRRDRPDRSQYSADAAANGYRRGGPRQQVYPQRQNDSSEDMPWKRPPPAENALSDNFSRSHEPLSQAWGTPLQEEPWKDQGAVCTGETWEPENAAIANDTWPDSNQTAVQTEAKDAVWTDPVPGTATPKAWGLQDPVGDTRKSQADTQPVDQGSSPISSSPGQVVAKKQLPAQTSTVKRTFNYAAAAAAGTSHAKPASLTTGLSTSVPISTSSPVLPPDSDSIAHGSPLEEFGSVHDTGDLKKRRSRSGRKTRPREHEIAEQDSSVEKSVPTSNGLPTDDFESHGNDLAAPSADASVESSITASNAWASRAADNDVAEDKRTEITSTAVVATPAAAVRTESTPTDTLSLQFGSFGLSGLDGVNWSATDQKLDPVPSNTIESKPNAAVPISPSTAVITAVPVKTSTAIPANIVSSALPVSNGLESVHHVQQPHDVRSNNIPSISMPPGSSSVSGSGIFPMLPVAPGGNFPPNYGAPYMMPPLHSYNPSLNSYENGTDLGSSRGPTLPPPGSLPLYDPAALPNMASGNGKYAGIPGLGDMSSLPPAPAGMTKDGLHGNVDLEKGSSIGTTGLPAGMDPLAAPYMMPGYPPSMQYPMYTYPNTPYGPPGMPPPGPNAFPFPPSGQVSSQGGRGGFGFDDGSVGIGGNSRGGSGLGESMYTPGYLSSTMTSSQKGPSDGAYKSGRAHSHPGNSLGGMGMAGGIVHGMPYSDYQGIPGVSNGVSGNGGGPGNWHNRQPGGGRADAGNGPNVVSNPSMAGGAQNSNLYGSAPNGAHGAYWTPQQGGYYS